MQQYQDPEEEKLKEDLRKLLDNANNERHEEGQSEKAIYYDGTYQWPKKKYKNEYERQFVQKCCTSKYTAPCLALIKEGKVPFRLVKAILRNSQSYWNDFLSFFKSNTSLNSLIGKDNIALLINKNTDECLALDPNENNENNELKIKNFFKNINDCNSFSFCTHGTGTYAHCLTRTHNDENYMLYLSNIPKGLIATKNGTIERAGQYKKIISSVLNAFNDMVGEKNINVTGVSSGNLLATKIAQQRAKEQQQIKQTLFLKHPAISCCGSPSVDDVAEVICDKNNSISADNIEIVQIDQKANIIAKILHPMSKYQELREKISSNDHSEKVCKNDNNINLNNNNELLKSFV